MIRNFLKKLAIGSALVLATTGVANAHPHVWVEANMEVVLNKKAEFTKLRHVWRFDEVFSSTIIFDFDTNADGKLGEEELNELTSTVQKSIADYDFYTALRSGNDVIEFYEPEKINAYYDNNQLIMFFEVNPAKPYNLKEQALRISASDTSFYVAFDFTEENVKLSGAEHVCNTEVINPDFDKLYADNSETFSEAFFNDANLVSDLGDEFYSWATVSC